MVLVIVSRNIDLSVGSLVGLIAMVYALLMTDWLPDVLGLGRGLPVPLGHRPRPRASRWARPSARFQGFIIAYVGVPSFIVTLGGLLSFRGVVWYLSSGAAVSGLDPTFQLIGGGARGLARRDADLGARHRRLRRDRRLARQQPAPAAAVRVPAAADVGRGPARRRRLRVVLGVAAFANSEPLAGGPGRPDRAEQNWHPDARRAAADPDRLPVPDHPADRRDARHDLPRTRRRFGRYVYAYGGNPDAAELAGINTRWTIMKTYVLMGILCAIAARSRRPGSTAATLDVGQSYELYVIAAAVIGGTSFAGGIGTIPGAVLGAFVMQSLAYGLSFIGVNSPGQNIVAGIVLDRSRSASTPTTAGGATMTARRQRRSTTVAERTPLVEMRNINVAFGGVHAVRDVTIDLHAGRGHRPRRRQRRRQVDADAGAVGRPPGRLRRDPHRRQARRDPQPARRQGLQHRDDLPDPRARRQPRRARPTCSSAAS